MESFKDYLKDSKKAKMCVHCRTMMDEDVEVGDDCPNCKMVWDRKPSSTTEEEE